MGQATSQILTAAQLKYQLKSKPTNNVSKKLDEYKKIANTKSGWKYMHDSCGPEFAKAVIYTYENIMKLLKEKGIAEVKIFASILDRDINVIRTGEAVKYLYKELEYDVTLKIDRPEKGVLVRNGGCDPNIATLIVRI